MTDKKEKILYSALELFANGGFNATSTSKIAKKAGVSEGLIFKHFRNKKGLLEAIMNSAEEQITLLFTPILIETEPQVVIKKTIELPFSIQETEYNFWKLQFKLKWEDEYNMPQKMEPLNKKLTWAFTELNYKTPKLEAQLLSQVLDAISSEILKGNLTNRTELEEFLKVKYQV
jgi:AcrR family transcriptional regulator